MEEPGAEPFDHEISRHRPILGSASGFIHLVVIDVEEIMRKALYLVLLVVASAVSGGCYVTQDASGQWFACEEYQAQNGPLTACTPIQAPF